MPTMEACKSLPPLMHGHAADSETRAASSRLCPDLIVPALVCAHVCLRRQQCCNAGRDPHLQCWLIKPSASYCDLQGRMFDAWDNMMREDQTDGCDHFRTAEAYLWDCRGHTTGMRMSGSCQVQLPSAAQGLQTGEETLPPWSLSQQCIGIWHQPAPHLKGFSVQ